MEIRTCDKCRCYYVCKQVKLLRDARCTDIFGHDEEEVYLDIMYGIAEICSEYLEAKK